MNTIDLQSPAAPAHAAMHPDEWQARMQLAACYRIFDMPRHLSQLSSTVCDLSKAAARMQ